MVEQVDGAEEMETCAEGGWGRTVPNWVFCTEAGSGMGVVVRMAATKSATVVKRVSCLMESAFSMASEIWTGMFGSKGF